MELAQTPAASTGAALLDAWQAWLAARNLQLVQASAPLGSGFWIAVHGERAVVMFGAPPDVVWDPGAGWGQGRDRAGEPAPDAVFVLAALDPAIAGSAAGDPGAGTVAAIYVADGQRRPAEPLAAPRRSPVAACAATATSPAPGTSRRPGKGVGPDAHRRRGARGAAGRERDRPRRGRRAATS